MTDPTKAQTTTATIIPLPLPKRERRKAEDKWSPQVMKFGFTPLPNLLLRAQGKLKLTPMQINVLVHLAEHWWEADKNPFPAKERIALRMGKSSRQIQRYITQLEKGGFVKRIARYSGRKAQTSNEYSLEGLVRKLKAVEPEFTKAANLNRNRRKKLEASSA